LLKGFQASRKQTGAQLRRDLAQDKTSRKSEVKRMLTGFKKLRREEDALMRKELAQGAAERRSEVGALVKDFQGSRKKTGDELRKDLAKGRKEMRSDFRKAQTEVRGDLKEAAAAWQELARMMQAKRAGVKVPPKVEAPVEEKVEAPIAEEIEMVEPPVAQEEIPDMEAKLLAAITEHPSGVTLAEVAESLGVVPVVLGRASRSLLERGLIRKEEKIYFPVAGE
jgi:hypothetical protein